MNSECTIKVGSFSDFYQATMAKEILESNGISCIITDLNISGLSMASNENSKLLVNSEHVEQAKQLLESFFS